VHVVGHDDEGVQRGVREMARDAQPASLHHPTGLVQPHLAVDNLAEQARLIADDKGEEMRTGLAGGVSDGTRLASNCPVALVRESST